MITLFTLYIEITELVDSKALWSEIEQYKVNLTDMIDVSYIYGTCSMDDCLAIISLCEKYGKNRSIHLQKEVV